MVSGEDITPAITVLVADDNTATRELIAEICRHCGAAVVECTNGIEAVDAFKKHQPDCSLIDFQMPEMDGLKAIAQIRALSPLARVFMVTQYDSENLRQAAAEAGADGFVPKDCLHMLPDLLKAERVLRMFDRLQGNTAYLVRVGGSASAHTWQVKGKPVALATEWTISGLNFLGFSTVPTNPPNFDAFLVHAPELQHDAEIYQYVGGDLGQNNPRRIVAMRTTPVTRGQAYWIRATNVYNRYFGPFEVVLSSPSGIDFGEHLGTAAFRLRNLTANKLTIALELVASEAPPAGQAAIAGVTPLLIRGALNLTNLTYGYTNLPTGVKRTWTLEPNGTQASETEVVLGLDRAAMSGAVGDQFAGILRFTDSLGSLQVNVGITAKIGSSAGLWVGNAAVTQVGRSTAALASPATSRLL